MIDRPEHDDFMLIIQALIDKDALVDNGTDSYLDALQRTVDPESVHYAARQRALRLVGAPDPALIATWIDGFVAGAMFQSMKNQGDTQSLDPDITPDDF